MTKVKRMVIIYNKPNGALQTGRGIFNLIKPFTQRTLWDSKEGRDFSGYRGFVSRQIYIDGRQGE